MRAELTALVDDLLAGSAGSGEVTLDDIGDALGTRAVSSEEIDAILDALEAAGRRIAEPEARDRVRDLRVVVAAARELTASLGRRPTTEEIASATKLAATDIRTALLLARVMGR